MDRKKPTDELAMAKSAAWAWYQHGTRSEPRPVPDSIPRRNLGAPKPTRYKLEVMNKKQSPTPSHSELPTNSLLDKYEVERISRELEFYIKTAGGGHRIGPESEKIGGKGKRESKKTKGSWLRGDGVVCGSIDDVVVVERGGRWRPENHVPVVEVGSCWPRRNHFYKELVVYGIDLTLAATYPDPCRGIMLSERHTLWSVGGPRDAAYPTPSRYSTGDGTIWSLDASDQL
ncbi:hypothetical protein LguiB_032812 [Lonicera macranthoides]